MGASDNMFGWDKLSWPMFRRQLPHGTSAAELRTEDFVNCVNEKSGEQHFVVDKSK